MPVSKYATAYKCGVSVRDNAKLHITKPIVLKLDIYKFFDSIPYSVVKDKVFPAKIYSEPLRILLSMLCYYRDSLPQGAPTSPSISNIIMYDFDLTVGKWCEDKGITYTRYCDDMTFSGDFPVKDVISFVTLKLKDINLRLNYKKTSVRFSSGQQNVTGVVVNEKLSLPSEYRRKIRQEIFYCQKFGIKEHLNKIGRNESASEYARKLLGRVTYCLSVNPDDIEFNRYKLWLAKTLKSM